MKRLSLFFFLLLIVWIIIASYLYVCKIRGHCDNKNQEARTEIADTLMTEPGILEQGQSMKEDSVAMTLDYLREAGTKKYYFEFASAELSVESEDNKYFSALRFYLENNPDVSVTIVGHACNRGSFAANDRFATLRAEAVRDYCIELGINKDQIKTVSKSDTEPAASNETEEGRKLNRRAEIIIN
ncbi:MAG: OmpA family protein [Bacteroidales bacterium]|nr:OmpA family protein [Bacteroidales bacterium]